MITHMITIKVDFTIKFLINKRTRNPHHVIFLVHGLYTLPSFKVIVHKYISIFYNKTIIYVQFYNLDTKPTSLRWQLVAVVRNYRRQPANNTLK